MSERIRREEVAELIVPSRLRNSEYRNQGDAQRDSASSHSKHGESSPPRQTAKGSF